MSSRFINKNVGNSANALSTINPYIIIIKNTSFCYFTNSAIKVLKEKTYISLNSSLVIDNCSFVENSALFGGAIYFNGTFNITVIQCGFQKNKAKIKNYENKLMGLGGSIFFQPSSSKILSTLNITNCLFEGNAADYFAPNIFSLVKIENIDSNTFINNIDYLNFTGKMFSLPLNIVLELESSNYSSRSIKFKSGTLFSLKFKLLDGSNQSLLFDDYTILSLKPYSISKCINI